MKRIFTSFWIVLVISIFSSACDESGMNELPVIAPELIEFKVVNPEAKGVVDRANGTIDLEVPVYADLTALIPQVHASYGSQISPPSGEPVDFTSPVEFTISNGGESKSYLVTVELGAMDTKSTRLLVLGTGDAVNSIANEDEKAAALWAINTFDLGQYMGFNQLAANPSVLEEIDVVWWHYDTSYDLADGDFALPPVALDPAVTEALANFRNNGGGIYLSGFATQYLEPLGVVEPGDGPNETGGAPAEFENPDNWGISFKGHTDHPIFQDLRKAEEDVAFLISGGAWRKDNKAWWAVWMEDFDFPTYGVDLASTEWDKDHNVLVLMAEFPGNEQQGKVVAFSAGAYDFLSTQGENTFMDNVYQITENILIYLATKEK
ncbi:MAG: DUF4960 domain-containing protein [Candidatus Cyclobacteriaceae bacterium M3_2C_046]